MRMPDSSGERIADRMRDGNALDEEIVSIIGQPMTEC
jgi:hypothetical protein